MQFLKFKSLCESINLATFVVALWIDDIESCIMHNDNKKILTHIGLTVFRGFCYIRTLIVFCDILKSPKDNLRAIDSLPKALACIVYLKNVLLNKLLMISVV